MADLEARRMAGSAYRKVVPPRVRDLITERLTPETRRGIKDGASWLMLPAERVGRVRAQHRLSRHYVAAASGTTVLADGRRAHVHPGLSESLAREINHAAVATALSAWKIPHFTVPGLDDRHTVIAVAKEDRSRTYLALSTLLGEYPGTVRPVVPAPRRGAKPGPGHAVATWRALGRAKVIRLSWLLADPTGQLLVDHECGVEIELWSREGTLLRGPRQNRVMRVAPAGPATHAAPLHAFSGYADPWSATPRVQTHAGFASPRADETPFPVDAVCMWSGPLTRPADSVGSGGTAAEDTTEDAREDIAELLLRSALRSLHQYAPWVRTVHVVAEAPPPSWLVPGGRLRITEAAAIAKNGEDPAHRLHRIPDVADRILHLPAGALLGRVLRTNALFTPGGLALFTPAPRQDPASRAWPSTVVRETGRLVATGVFAGPQAYLTPLLAEVAPLADAARAAGDPDPLPALHHYLGLPDRRTLERAGRYAAVHAAAPRLDVHLDRLLVRRDSEFLQLAGVVDAAARPEAVARIRRFLGAYLPVPGPFEARTPVRGQGVPV